MNPTLVFHHIPKTGGSTLRFILAQEYSKIFTLDWHEPQISIAAFEKLDRHSQNGFEVIQGHAALELAKYIDNKILLTYLRDPVDCFISQYYFIKRFPQHRSYPALASVDTIGGYIEFAARHNEDNLQTRFLSDSLMSNFGELRKGNDGHDLRKMLMEAKERLQTFNFVFLTPQFDLSLLILKRELKWRREPYYFTRNKTGGRPPMDGFSPAIIEKIRELVKYDLELYEFAMTINGKLTTEQNLKEELERFRSLNRLRKPLTMARHYAQSGYMRLLHKLG